MVAGWDVPEYYNDTIQEISEDVIVSAYNSGTVKDFKTVGADGIWLLAYNHTDSELAIKSCQAIGLVYEHRLEERDCDLSEGVVEFTDGISTISIGKSTLEDVENAFGEQKYITHEDDLENTEYKNEKATTFMYEPDEGKWLLYITFDENDVSKYFTYRGEYWMQFDC